MKASSSLSVLFLFLSAVNARADVHLVVTGTAKFGDAAPIYSCLAYQGCEKTTFTLGTENRLHIYTTKTLETVLADLARCDFAEADVNSISYFNGDETVALALDPSQYNMSYPFGKTGSVWPSKGRLPKPSAPAGTVFANLAPAIFGTSKMNEIHALEGRLGDIADASQIAEIIRTLGIDTLGYTVSIGTLGEGVGAVTDHDTKTIEVAQSTSGDELVRTIRHEFDHVLQSKLAGQCGSGNAFTEHDVRERAAYLNDAHFSNDTDDSFYLDRIQDYKNL